MYNWKVVLLTLGVLVGLKIWSPYLVDNIKWSYFDVLHQQKESQLIDNIVLVDIDEKSLDKYGQYPWPRNIYADIMLDTVKKWVPITYDAFMDYRVGGTEVSAKGKAIIQKLIKGENVDLDSSGLSKREWNELMIAFDLKDKLI